MRDLMSAGRELGPWHLAVQVTRDLNTRDLQSESGTVRPAVNLYDPTKAFTRLLRQLFPDGMEGRSVLDCACNCGAYLFLCKDHGAGKCFGFDARGHWITQADWLLEHREGDHADMTFDVCALHDVPALRLEQFDVVLFRGILYHLPDPIVGLGIAAEQTRELLLMHTASIRGWPDGALVASHETVEHPLSGIHGLHWFPTGPRVLMDMTRHAGLPEARCHRWWAPGGTERHDRVDLVAARTAAALSAYDSRRPTDLMGRMIELANVSIPPGSRVAVLADAVPDLPYREALAFEPGADAIASLAACEADYLLTAGQGLRRSGELGLMAYADQTFAIAGQAPGVSVIHDLGRRRASAS